jgi:glycosyltransferase 2 family protein
MSVQLRGKIVLSLVFGVLVVAALSLVADARQLVATLRGFAWGLAPAILGLTLFNYALRFLKWQYYLRLIGVRGLSTGDSLGIFFSAFTMVMTPGKVGELLTSYLLRRVAGTPVAASAPIIVAERLTDGLAMVGLAALGLTSVRFGWPVLALTLVGGAVGVALVQHRPLAERLLVAGERSRVRALATRVHHLREFYESAYELLRPGPLGLAVAIGFVSWFGECVAFYLVLLGLGLPASWSLLIAATAILALATLIGSVSMLPGGLGVADASIAGMLLLVVAPLTALMTRDVAVAASLLIRFATLWFGVLLGALVLLLYHRRFGALPDLTRDGREAVPGGAEGYATATTERSRS